MIQWLKPHHEEIKSSKSLTTLGIFLSFIHFVTALQWSQWSQWSSTSPQEAPICWSLLPFCENWQTFFSPYTHHITTAYGVLALLALFLLCFRFTMVIGWWLLLISFTTKWVFYLSDNTLADNIHCFLFFIEFCFFFVPHKKNTITTLIISMYFASGMLKIQSDWFTGSWLSIHLTDWPIKAVEWVAAACVAIELTLPFGLISKRSKKFLLSFFLFASYHLFYWIYISPFVASIQMLCLLYLAINFYEEKAKGRDYIYQPFYRGTETHPWWTLSTMFIFGVIQILPLWSETILPKKFPLRLSSYSANIHCEQYNFIHFKQSIISTHESGSMSSCHPLLNFHKAKTLCKKYEGKHDFTGVTSYFVTQKILSSNDTREFEFENICQVDSLVDFVDYLADPLANPDQKNQLSKEEP